MLAAAARKRMMLMIRNLFMLRSLCLTRTKEQVKSDGYYSCLVICCSVSFVEASNSISIIFVNMPLELTVYSEIF